MLLRLLYNLMFRSNISFIDAQNYCNRVGIRRVLRVEEPFPNRVLQCRLEQMRSHWSYDSGHMLEVITPLR
jgi:hypothetical protein